MKILVAGEFSGRVRDAFRAKGHNAVSCDLLDSEKPGPHLKCDLREVIYQKDWDMMVCHPSCRFTAVSGARWFKGRMQEQEQAVGFVLRLWNAPIARIALEHPISILSTWWLPPTQIIQPWQFGHGETKATCLWLKNLPVLTPANIVEGRTARVHRESPGPDRWKNRSRTFTGIADAMAEQWGVFSLILALLLTSCAQSQQARYPDESVIVAGNEKHPTLIVSHYAGQDWTEWEGQE